MCIFADKVKHVSGTKILVYETEIGSQITVYENVVATDPHATKNGNNSLEIYL
jgi:hypothetical protein